MSSIAREAATLRAIVRASTRFASDDQRDAVADEFTQFVNCARLQPSGRRRLLQFLHASRALETTLGSVAQARGLPAPSPPGMTAYLNQLANCTPSAIPQAVRDNCAARVAKVRNQLAHGAGKYPAGEHQLNSGFDAARACMALVLA